MSDEIIIIIISIASMLIGIYLSRRSSHLLSHGIRANAVVISNRCERSSESEMFYPTLRFVTGTGEEIIRELKIGRTPAIEKGTETEVLYDPDDPNDFMIKDTFVLELLPKILICVGTIGIVFIVFELLNITNLI